jgi:hypothetical protein
MAFAVFLRDTINRVAATTPNINTNHRRRFSLDNMDTTYLLSCVILLTMYCQLNSAVEDVTSAAVVLDSFGTTLVVEDEDDDVVGLVAAGAASLAFLRSSSSCSA